MIAYHTWMSSFVLCDDTVSVIQEAYLQLPLEPYYTQTQHQLASTAWLQLYSILCNALSLCVPTN